MAHGDDKLVARLVLLVQTEPNTTRTHTATRVRSRGESGGGGAQFMRSEMCVRVCVGVDGHGGGVFLTGSSTARAAAVHGNEPIAREHIIM